MKTTNTMKVKSEERMNWIEGVLRNLDFKKTHDCMWVKIYEKDDIEYILSREW